MLQQAVSYSRRHALRVEAPAGVWVYWSCGGHNDTSRVRNLSAGGVFIETSEAVALGAMTKLDFLVQEGQIRVEALVRHVNSSSGMGLKFTAVKGEDLPNLTALLSRLSSSS